MQVALFKKISEIPLEKLPDDRWEGFLSKDMATKSNKYQKFINEGNEALHSALKAHFDVLVTYLSELEVYLSSIISTKMGVEECLTHENHLHAIAKGIYKRMSEYSFWRYKNGVNKTSCSVIKCVAGHANGYDAICRAFMLETLLSEYIGESNRLCVFRVKNKLSARELRELKKRCLLIFSKRPVEKWGFKLLNAQMYLLSMQMTGIPGILYNEILRSALRKLIVRCEYRAYDLINEASQRPDLCKKSTKVNNFMDDADFDGKIMCTPFNNYGMDMTGLSGSWVDQNLFTFCRYSTKLMSILLYLDKVANTKRMQSYEEVVKKTLPSYVNSSSMFKTNFEINKKFSNSKRKRSRMVVKKIRSAIDTRLNELLRSRHIQSKLFERLKVRLTGCCALIEMTKPSHSRSMNYADTTIAAARAIIHTEATDYMMHYIRAQAPDFFCESDFAQACPVMPCFCRMFTFESISKSDDKNSFGFLQTFVYNVEDLNETFFVLERDFAHHNVPFILNAGHDFCVCFNSERSERNISYHCRDFITALVLWALIFETENNWTFSDMDLSSIYKPEIEALYNK